MAINTLQLRETIAVVGQIGDTTTGSQQSAQYGQAPLLNISTVWNFGTGTNTNAPAQIYADVWYLASRTLAGTTYDSLTLWNSLKDFEGNPINLTLVKRVQMTLAVPAGNNPLYIGPQNQTHAWGSANTPWPGGVGATVYDSVVWDWRTTNPWGWAVASSPASVLPVYNPNATPQTYTIWIFGDE